MMNPIRRLHLDPFLAMILLMVLAATVVPAQGIGKTFFKHLTTAAIALLFFMHGAKLSREAVLAGVGHWRLHLLVLATTFVLFPLLGLALHPLVPTVLTPETYQGFLYLCALPATVQSAIAFTSVARGNVAAAICSAATSSLLGVFLSPLLVGLLLSAQGQTDLASSISAVMLQLLLPFVLGHLSRPLTANWIAKNRRLIKITDQSSILLVVYTAFSEAVLEGIWSRVSLGTLLVIGIVSFVLLAVVLVFTTYSARARLQQGRRNHHRLLRLEEKPRQRYPDGEHPLSARQRRHPCPAADAFPPNPADDLRRAGAALRPTPAG